MIITRPMGTGHPIAPAGEHFSIYTNAAAGPGIHPYATLIDVEPERADDGHAAESATEAMAMALSLGNPGIRYIVEHVSARPHLRRTPLVWFRDGEAHDRPEGAVMSADRNLAARILADYLAGILQAGDQVSVTLHTGPRVVNLATPGERPYERVAQAGETVTFICGQP